LRDLRCHHLASMPSAPKLGAPANTFQPSPRAIKQTRDQ
jgi:hypothetical protein